MKCLLILCDGLSDRPVKGKTPLEAAKTPNMDSMARNGITGIMDPVGVGIRPGSDTSHLSLFGYNPFEVYTGRGPFEAAGAGIKLEKGDIASRCNFATLKNGKIVGRRAGREEYGLEKLAKEIQKIKLEGVELIFKRCAGHRCVLVLRGKNLSPNVMDTDPEETDVPPAESKAKDGNEDSKRTAKLLNEFTRKTMEILREHPINKERIQKGMLPANIIICRGTGMQPHIENFEERYHMKAVCISATTLITGVCKSLGMDHIEVKGANGHVDSKIGNKAEAAIDALKKYDFVFLHIKGADEASHDRDFEKKKRFIERIDSEVIAPILKNVKDTVIVLTADHSTPVSTGDHSADPTPIAILGNVRVDQVTSFTERECAEGGLGRICGISLMGILLDLCNRSELFGA